MQTTWLALVGSWAGMGTVRDNVRDEIDAVFEALGEIEVKNIAGPVRVFRVLGQGEITPSSH